MPTTMHIHTLPPSQRTPAMSLVPHPSHPTTTTNTDHCRDNYHRYRSLTSASPLPHPQPSHIDPIPLHVASFSPAFPSPAAPLNYNLPSSPAPPPSLLHDASPSTTDATSSYYHDHDHNHRRYYQSAEPVVERPHRHVLDNHHHAVHPQGLHHHHTVNRYSDAPLSHPYPYPSPSSHQQQHHHRDILYHQSQTTTPIPLFPSPLPASSSTSSFSSSAALTAPSFLNPTTTTTLPPTATTTITTATTTSSHLVPGSVCASTKVKVCGWCGTSSTSQWRVGPTTGSIEMATLCNACGINYRRALGKTITDQLDLDVLALQTGRGRLSIQKALKRVRKQSAAVSNIGVFSQQQGRVGRRCGYAAAAAAASQVGAPALTLTTPEMGAERSGGGSRSSRSTGVMMAGGITNDALRSVHEQQQQQQDNVIGAAAGRRSDLGLRNPYVKQAQHAAHGYAFEQAQTHTLGQALGQAKAPPRREKIAVTALLQQQQDCGSTCDDKSVANHDDGGTKIGRAMSTPSSSDRYMHGYGHAAALTPAVRKGRPHSGQGHEQKAQQQQEEPVVKRQRGKIDVASLLIDEDSAGSHCIRSNSGTSSSDEMGQDDARRSPMEQGVVKASSNEKIIKLSNGKEEERRGKFLPSPPMSRVSSNGSLGVCVRERGDSGDKNTTAIINNGRSVW